METASVAFEGKAKAFFPDSLFCSFVLVIVEHEAERRPGWDACPWWFKASCVWGLLKALKGNSDHKLSPGALQKP